MSVSPGKPIMNVGSWSIIDQALGQYFTVYWPSSKFVHRPNEVNIEPSCD